MNLKQYEKLEDNFIFNILLDHDIHLKSGFNRMLQTGGAQQFM